MLTISDFRETTTSRGPTSSCPQHFLVLQILVFSSLLSGRSEDTWVINAWTPQLSFLDLPFWFFFFDPDIYDTPRRLRGLEPRLHAAAVHLRRSSSFVFFRLKKSYICKYHKAGRGQEPWYSLEGISIAITPPGCVGTSKNGSGVCFLIQSHSPSLQNIFTSSLQSSVAQKRRANSIKQRRCSHQPLSSKIPWETVDAKDAESTVAVSARCALPTIRSNNARECFCNPNHRADLSRCWPSAKRSFPQSTPTHKLLSSSVLCSRNTSFLPSPVREVRRLVGYQFLNFVLRLVSILRSSLDLLFLSFLLCFWNFFFVKATLSDLFDTLAGLQLQLCPERKRRKR